MAVYGVQPVKETDVPKLIDLIRADGLIEHLRLYQPDVDVYKRQTQVWAPARLSLPRNDR